MTKVDLVPLPHQEAIEYFRSKGYAHQLQRFHHLDVFREEHARNWVVAKAMRDDISSAIRSELDKALTEGRTLSQFQTDLAPRLQQMGWWGKDIQEDPVTGEQDEVQLGSMNRLRVIFDTNLRTAHAAGHWAAIQRTKRAFPYLQYIQIQRPSKRHDHARFHDKIWAVDDPIWKRIYPPNGYFCGCTVIQRTEGWMKRNNRAVSEPVDLEEAEWVHKRSGEVHMIPQGVTPGFDTNPGAVWLDIAHDWEAMTPDLPPERRDRERALMEGLRLRRVSDGRESLIVTDSDSQPVSYRTASRTNPDRVSLKGLAIPDQAGFLHSHITDSSFSPDDLDVLFDNAAYSITAITPGGATWRAVRTPNMVVRPYITEFRTVLAENYDELRSNPDGEMIYGHARMLWLEKKGVLTYSWRMSERVRQIMDANSDLIRRLTNARS